MTKRRLSTMAGCAAALLVAVGSPSPSAARTGPVQVGAAVYTVAFQSDPDPRYRATLAGYDSITAETAMKIEALQPQRGQFDFAAADGMVAFAEGHGQEVFGHTLTWCSDSTMPGWLRNGSWSRASLLTVLEQHITAVMTHFRGRVSAWDVVNEALNEDGSRRDCLWKRVIGDDWIDHAFRFARSADPGAKLFYNEYGAEVPNAKHEGTVNLVRDLRQRGVPVDGVGLQFHVGLPLPIPAQVEEAIRRLGDLGVEVHISEMDVPISSWGGTVERKLARQAEVYRAVAAACHAQPACFRITTWGFTDRYTWRLPWGSTLPLPFDSEYRPKPAWMAIQEAIHPPSPPPPPGQSPPPAPSPPPEPTPVSAGSASRGTAVTATQRRPLSLTARLRRQRVRTWLERRSLAALVHVDGAREASVQLVARVRGLTIGRATVQLRDGLPQSAAVSITSPGARRLRALNGARVVLAAVATDSDGRRTQAISRVRPR